MVNNHHAKVQDHRLELQEYTYKFLERLCCDFCTAPALKGVCLTGTGTPLLRIKTLWSSCLAITIKSILRVKDLALVLRKKTDAAGQSIFSVQKLLLRELRVIITVIIKL